MPALRHGEFSLSKANLARYDGAELAKAIALHADDLKTALHQFEQAMVERSAKVAAEGENSMNCLPEKILHGG